MEIVNAHPSIHLESAPDGLTRGLADRAGKAHRYQNSHDKAWQRPTTRVHGSQLLLGQRVRAQLRREGAQTRPSTLSSASARSFTGKACADAIIDSEGR